MTTEQRSGSTSVEVRRAAYTLYVALIALPVFLVLHYTHYLVANWVLSRRQSDQTSRGGRFP